VTEGDDQDETIFIARRVANEFGPAAMIAHACGEGIKLLRTLMATCSWLKSPMLDQAHHFAKSEE
jgi:hypothetical protein